MKCVCCNKNIVSWSQNKPIDNLLRKEWGLNRGLYNLFTLREGRHCPNCHNNFRSIGLAEGIIRIVSPKSKNMNNLVELINKKGLKVAEINSCGQLHQQLGKINKLYYSEYVEKSKAGKKNHTKKVKSIDIMNIEYPNNNFDLVIHSETLEHVPDPKKAISECLRILKPGGYLIFTIPIIWSRKTKQKIKLKRNSSNMEFIGKKSYHGYGRKDCIVWWEFGRDAVELLGINVLYSNPKSQLYVFGLKKGSNNVYKNKTLGYILKEFAYSITSQRPKIKQGVFENE